MTTENPPQTFDEQGAVPRDSDALPDSDALKVSLDGYEGPIDVLLSLARDQKVDLTKISILQLADQYLDFIQQARQLRLEIAADYLVMAAWLAYLKSRLLLPQPDEQSNEPSPSEMAAILAFQLQRLQAMQQAGEKLIALPRLGRDVMSRGMPERLTVVVTPVYKLTLYDLLKAYGSHVKRQEPARLAIEPLSLFSMDDALKRLNNMLGSTLEWTSLLEFLPPEFDTGLKRRSAVAATFAATLEMVRSGKLALRQEKTFGPIFLKAVVNEGNGDQTHE